jgi:glycosyltransferase involved in cell wall biosynthesis
MKIVIVGPGIMPIPPIGWGAVESLIWDYSEYLKKNGPDVIITNTQNLNEVLNQINNYKPDVVHIQYDNYYPLINHIKGAIKIITSHYGYITNKMSGGYMHIMNGFKNSDAYIFCLSPEIKAIYQKFGISDDRLIVQPNGADSNKFKYNENILYPDRSIYLAKVTDRKNNICIKIFQIYILQVTKMIIDLILIVHNIWVNGKKNIYMNI